MRWSVECEVQVWSVKCGVWSVDCEVWGKCSHRGRAQVMFVDSNSATGSHKACTHGPGWRTAHASSIDEKGVIRPYQGLALIRSCVSLWSFDIAWAWWQVQMIFWLACARTSTKKGCGDFLTRLTRLRSRYWEKVSKSLQQMCCWLWVLLPTLLLPWEDLVLEHNRHGDIPWRGPYQRWAGLFATNWFPGNCLTVWRWKDHERPVFLSFMLDAKQPCDEEEQV